MTQGTCSKPVIAGLNPAPAADCHDHLQIQPYRPDAIPDIVKLTQMTLGTGPAIRKTEAFWQWKHQANPFGPSCGFCARIEESQSLVGLRVLMRWAFCTPDEQLLHAVRAVDTATHPAFQRRGIFSLLTGQAINELTAESVPFIFNTPNRRSLPGYLKLGWHRVTSWPLFIKILRPLRMLQKRWPGGPTSPSPDQFEAYFGPDVLPWPAFVARYGPLIPKLVAASEAQRHRVGCRTPRDLAYLTWRYGQHPHLTYGVGVLEDEAGLAGFAVLRPNLRYGWQEMVLTDIFLARSSPDRGTHLLQKLCRQLRGDYLIAHFAEGTLERQWLRATGFVKVPRRGITFTVRPLHLGSSNLCDPSAWDLTLGDLEIF